MTHPEIIEAENTGYGFDNKPESEVCSECGGVGCCFCLEPDRED